MRRDRRASAVAVREPIAIERVADEARFHRVAARSRHAPLRRRGGKAFTALNELTLTIRRGEFIALLGPSGCGKSTALNCIAGLLPLSGGSIWLDDERIDTLPPEKRGFGMVFQNYALFPHMTVAKNVGFGLRMRGVPARRDRAARRARDEARAADRAGAQAARPALRRPAAARGDRARDRHRAAADPDGRAAVEPRRQAAHRDARRDPPHPPRARPRDDLRHARPGRGAVAGRPHRRDEGRRRAADRRRRRKSTRSRRTCTSRASWATATCSSSTSRASSGDRVTLDRHRTSGSPACASSRSTGKRAAVAIRPEEMRRRAARGGDNVDRRHVSTTSSTAAAIRWSTSSRRRGTLLHVRAPVDVALGDSGARARAGRARARVSARLSDERRAAR